MPPHEFLDRLAAEQREKEPTKEQRTGDFQITLDLLRRTPDEAIKIARDLLGTDLFHQVTLTESIPQWWEQGALSDEEPDQVLAVEPTSPELALVSHELAPVTHVEVPS